MQHQATMPANLALIKYMGKQNGQPINASLSYTLRQQKSYVCIKALKPDLKDVWQPLKAHRFLPQQGAEVSDQIRKAHSLVSLQLTSGQQKRFLDHFQFLKNRWHIKGRYCIFSGNSFAADCGLASSASSFAALTQATYQMACHQHSIQPAVSASLDIDGGLSDFTSLGLESDPAELTSLGLESGAGVRAAGLGELASLGRQGLALLSAQGSGSSARSFFAPWCVWEKGRVYKVDLPYYNSGGDAIGGDAIGGDAIGGDAIGGDAIGGDATGGCVLQHQCVMVDGGAKKISSSEAHRRVMLSPLIEGRSERAQQRLQALLKALRQDHWQRVFEICYDEFEDMHQLFATARPAFGYRTSKTNEVLMQVKALWKRHGDGPVVTLDAGPNVHLLYRPGCKARLSVA